MKFVTRDELHYRAMGCIRDLFCSSQVLPLSEGTVRNYLSASIKMLGARNRG